jgi:hypothetical protein
MSENVGASTSRNPKGLHGLYRDNFTLLVYGGIGQFPALSLMLMLDFSFFLNNSNPRVGFRVMFLEENVY